MFLVLSAIIACSGGAEPAPAEVAPATEQAPAAEPAAEATEAAAT